MNNRKFYLGFFSLDKEIVIDRLPVKGSFPSWLTGTLLRNGPAQFEVGEKKLQHWFDGFAMLHAFSFANGTVSYANKFLQSNAFRHAKETGTLGFAEFATDPCRSIFQRFTQMFSPRVTDNANVNISHIANKFFALTETPLPIAFDAKTLETLGVAGYDDTSKSHLTTAHPHYDFDNKEHINYFTHFSRRSAYHIYHVANGTMKRDITAIVPVGEPGYMHSFGMTQKYAVLAEYPLVVNPLKLLLSGKPFIENFVWKPEQGTRFIVIERHTGKLIGNYMTKAFFAFHHINAFEDGNTIVIDISSYPDASIINSLYLDVLRGIADKPIVSAGEFRRYRISLENPAVNYEVISQDAIELPRINYECNNAKPYRFAYGVSHDKTNPNDFLNRLIKVDIQNGHCAVWREDNCYPGEPVFIQSPNAAQQDDGVVLSVVLDTTLGSSFLLILDAASFEERARAEVPHHIPFGFHGQYYADIS